MSRGHRVCGDSSILSPVLWASLTVFLQDGSGLAFRRRRHAQCAIFLRITALSLPPSPIPPHRTPMQAQPSATSLDAFRTG
ncbi:hypothetical protein DFP72DRAFT_1066146 [Ephemerocybe angulata]|uniref:Uncharacterized protein n=1 Tax=Ephemerocybe angulata TaxID=980116 RepID=A0A8H6I4G9_9AGAR|nr:hypothetical protein DFP72DRAFT_1066146 [Tulosesus angulatus]